MTRNQKAYRRGKIRARETAIEFQYHFEGYTDDIWPEAEDPRLNWSIFEWTDHFRKIGRRYGLIREFKENAIL